jgi:hypothetical protein
MTTALPPQVKNKSKKTKIFDYRVPIEVGAQRGGIVGTLYWVPEPGGLPIAAVISLLIVLALLIAFAVFMRRRRARQELSDPAGRAPDVPQEKVGEAW